MINKQHYTIPDKVYLLDCIMCTTAIVVNFTQSWGALYAGYTLAYNYTDTTHVAKHIKCKMLQYPI